MLKLKHAAPPRGAPWLSLPAPIPIVRLPPPPLLMLLGTSRRAAMGLRHLLSLPLLPIVLSLVMCTLLRLLVVAVGGHAAQLLLLPLAALLLLMLPLLQETRPRSRLRHADCRGRGPSVPSSSTSDRSASTSGVAAVATLAGGRSCRG